MIVSDYRGLTVKEIAEIRRALRKQDITLPRRQEPPDADRRRGVGRRGAQPAARSARPRSRFGTDEAGDRQGRPRRHAARTRSSGSRAASWATSAIDADARHPTRRPCPSREVLLAKLAGGMQAPVGTMAGLLAAPLRNLGYALAQVAEQKRPQAPDA